jgi:2'-5' RNA ligase
MRAFVAVAVPSVIGDRPAHLTLRFLGEVPPSAVPDLATAIGRAVRDHPAFRLVLEGVGAFPSSAKPSVVWAGVTEGREALTGLAARVDGALAGLPVLPDSRAFVPHVTLLRVRGSRELARARVLLETEARRRFGETTVTEVVLFESDLRPEGAVHRALGRFPLAPANAESPT